MTRCSTFVLWLLLTGTSWAYPGAASAAAQVWVLPVDGAIGPATADYIHRAFEQADKDRPELIILKMDTPGGLDNAMRSIVQDIMAASIPIATFVAPSGARAASAGTYILYASHIAAMAPGTNLGAATPVQIGGGMPGAAPPESDEKKSEESGDAMHRKVVSDASAYLRSLAQLRGRNKEWAEQAVREAASLSAEEALKLRVTEFIAADVPDLLRQLNGYKVAVLGIERTLHTADAEVRERRPDWRYRLLSIITNPNVAYILMLLGIYGLFFELANPGFILPGVAGLICLVIALYAFQVLPVNYAGLALMLIGLAFMAAEVFVPSFGALGVGGAIAFVVGSIILMDTDAEGFVIAWPLIAGVALTSALFSMFVVSLAVRARNRPVVSGSEELIGMHGTVIALRADKALIRVHGESWWCRSRVPLHPGQTVAVRKVNDLVLEVEPVDSQER